MLSEHGRGGHFAPSEVPELYAQDIIQMMGDNYPTQRTVLLDVNTIRIQVL
jgi:hypothetical protein